MFGHNSFTHPFEAPNGWMQPTETKTFNSLWVGDQHEITTTGGKNKFRKTPSPPPNVSRKQIQHQTKGTIYKYLPDRPKYHQYITGSNYKTDYQSRERLASKYTQITDLNEELGGIEQELDGVYAKKEELEGKLVSLTQKLDNLNDSYERELASYTTTYWKDNAFNQRKSQDMANGAKKWKQAKAREKARKRGRRRAETEIPMVSVKIDTTATNISPDWKVSHQFTRQHGMESLWFFMDAIQNDALCGNQQRDALFHGC